MGYICICIYIYVYGHAPQLRCQKSLVLDFPHNGEYTREVLSAGVVWDMIGRIWRDIGRNGCWTGRNWNGSCGVRTISHEIRLMAW